MPNPVALITGASRGIGQACALALAKSGYDIAIAGVSEPKETIERVMALGRQAFSTISDVSQPALHASVLAAVRQRFGRLDTLVNNAGIAPKVRADLLEASEESYDQVMAVNLKGPYFMTQKAARWMVEQRRERPQNRFCIINISSISAYTASVMRGEYCLSKAGMSMMTKLFAARLADSGVVVFEIRPGVVMTDMTKVVKEKYDKLIAEGLTPIRQWVQPEDVGTAVAACATGQIPMSTGQAIDVDGGFHLRIL
jgi:NAD(P)-dependent dehydrogenase (short-subunit alcohol dehydrogenase family)